jgi:hypothetical protein
MAKPTTSFATPEEIQLLTRKADAIVATTPDWVQADGFNIPRINKAFEHTLGIQLDGNTQRVCNIVKKCVVGMYTELGALETGTCHMGSSVNPYPLYVQLSVLLRHLVNVGLEGLHLSPLRGQLEVELKEVLGELLSLAWAAGTILRYARNSVHEGMAAASEFLSDLKARFERLGVVQAIVDEEEQERQQEREKHEDSPMADAVRECDLRWKPTLDKARESCPNGGSSRGEK